MAVRAGAPKPDISTVEAFIETLRAAESIAYSASVSGTYLSTVAWPELGIWEEIQPKTTRVVTERVASVVARGEAEIGFQAMSEILPIEGAELAGLLPDELQQVADGARRHDGAHGKSRSGPEARRVSLSDAAATVVQSTGLMPVALDEPPGAR